jgi:WD40 repeat protein
VRSLVFSPDGKTLAVGFSSPVKEEVRDRPGELRLWDVAGGKPGVTLQGPAPSIPCTAFSPDGRTLAAGGGDRLVHLWDTKTGRRQVPLPGHPGPITALAFSPDRKTLAAACYREDPKRAEAVHGEVWLWDLEASQVRATLRAGCVITLAFSPDGKALATGNWPSGKGDKQEEQGTIELWEVGTGKRRARLDPHEFLLPSLAFSPDGRLLASVGLREKTDRSRPIDLHLGEIKLWDTATGKERGTLAAATITGCAAFLPDGKTLASAGGIGQSLTGAVELWNVPTRQRTTALEGYFFDLESFFGGLAFSPDAKVLAVVHKDGSVQLFDVEVPAPPGE